MAAQETTASLNRPSGLLEPCAVTSRSHGSQGGGAQQCAPPTRQGRYGRWPRQAGGSEIKSRTQSVVDDLLLVWADDANWFVKARFDHLFNGDHDRPAVTFQSYLSGSAEAIKRWSDWPGRCRTGL
jgi:hypothetical protein